MDLSLSLSLSLWTFYGQLWEIRANGNIITSHNMCMKAGINDGRNGQDLGAEQSGSIM